MSERVARKAQEARAPALSDKELLALVSKARAGKLTYAEKAALRAALALSGGVTVIDPTATRVRVQPKGTEYATITRVKASICAKCGQQRGRSHKRECEHWREVTDHTQAPLVMIENDCFRALGTVRRRKYGPAETLVLLYAIMSGRFLKAVTPHVAELMEAAGQIEPAAAEAIRALAARYANAVRKAGSAKEEEEE